MKTYARMKQRNVIWTCRPSSTEDCDSINLKTLLLIWINWSLLVDSWQIILRVFWMSFSHVTIFILIENKSKIRNNRLKQTNHDNNMSNEGEQRLEKVYFICQAYVWQCLIVNVCSFKSNCWHRQSCKLNVAEKRREVLNMDLKRTRKRIAGKHVEQPNKRLQNRKQNEVRK